MEIRPRIRTTDALGRYVLRHSEQYGCENLAVRPGALSIRQRPFSSSRHTFWGGTHRQSPEAIRELKKGRLTCAPWY